MFGRPTYCHAVGMWRSSFCRGWRNSPCGMRRPCHLPSPGRHRPRRRLGGHHWPARHSHWRAGCVLAWPRSRDEKDPPALQSPIESNEIRLPVTDLCSPCKTANKTFTTDTRVIMSDESKANPTGQSQKYRQETHVEPGGKAFVVQHGNMVVYQWKPEYRIEQYEFSAPLTAPGRCAPSRAGCCGRKTGLSHLIRHGDIEKSSI